MLSIVRRGPSMEPQLRRDLSIARATIGRLERRGDQLVDDKVTLTRRVRTLESENAQLRTAIDEGTQECEGCEAANARVSLFRRLLGTPKPTEVQLAACLQENAQLRAMLEPGWPTVPAVAS